MKLKIISGGQTGVDQAALRAAKALGIPTGGTMPKGWLTEDGARPEFAELYGMVESTVHGYPARTKKNVVNSDVTLWYGPTGSLGYFAARNAAVKFRKPFFILPMLGRQAIAGAVEDLREFIAKGQNVTINIAGSRESRQPGVGEAAERDLTTLFRDLLEAIGGEGREA